MKIKIDGEEEMTELVKLNSGVRTVSQHSVAVQWFTRRKIIQKSQLINLSILH
jgi:hypothetical protein